MFGPTLVPIAAAYAVAHYFSLLVLEGQRMIIRISDPAGRGWDLFGTVDYAIDWTLVSTDTIAWVQTLAIAVGHVMGVAAAHDVAISRLRPSPRGSVAVPDAGGDDSLHRARPVPAAGRLSRAVLGLGEPFSQP